MKRFIAVLALFAALQGVSSAQQKGFQGFVSVGRNDAVTAGEIDNDVLTLKTFDLIGGYRVLPNNSSVQVLNYSFPSFWMPVSSTSL